MVGMLSLGIIAGGAPQVILQPTSPMVYADHWAIRAFAKDSRLTTRLAEALHARSGTLAVSWMNFGEYST